MHSKLSRVPLRTLEGFYVIYITLDVVQADVPYLIVVDVIYRGQNVADMVFNRIARRSAHPYDSDHIVFIDE